MNTNNTAKPTLKQRIKHYAPEIAVGGLAIAGVVGYIYAMKATIPNMTRSFAAHAADPSIEIVAGGDEAFVVLAKEAAQRLFDEGSIAITEGAQHLVLSLVTE